MKPFRLMLRFRLLFLFLPIFCQPLLAQQTTFYTESQRQYRRGLDLYGQRLFGLAQERFERVNTPLAVDEMQLRPVNEAQWEEMRTLAELYEAKAATRLEQPDAEMLVYDFLRTHTPSPIAAQAALEVGDHYFNSKEYEQALRFYDMAPTASPVGKTAEEIQFKKAYCYFVTKDFGNAKSGFNNLRNNTASDWYIPANYYYGCCAFFEKKYDEAAASFKRCEGAPQYSKLAPYYLCQIYFAQKKYNDVIAYGEPRTKDNSLRNLAEINQMVGQSYYELGDFKRARPFLEYGSANGAKMRAADHYQLGYTQYMAGDYAKAIDNFEQLNNQDSLLGQNAHYHKGDCYLQTGNKFNARTAFGQASKMPFDPSVREDALFNYAKLSYELKYDRDAIDALQKIPPESRYREQAQALMAEVLLNTRDYDRALSLLDGVPNRSQKLNATYQQLAYLRGVQLYQNNQDEEARRFFNRALDYPIDKRTTTLVSYWLGAIANEQKEYPISKNHMNAFLGQAKNYNDLPEESSLYMGQYVQGYNLLQTKDYAGAQTQFKASVDGINRNKAAIRSDQIKNGVLGDAILRSGDCSFKLGKYTEAIKYYDEAVRNRYDGFEYALYQKAIIKGLQNEPLDKIVLLEELSTKYPGSRYADEALLQLGDTYMGIGKLNEASVPLKKLTTEYRGKSPLVNQALLKLGLISYNQGNTTAATNYYKQVFANNPETAEAKDALVALEEIYVRDLNRPDEYFNFLSTIPGYDVSDMAKDSVTFRSAQAQYERGNFQGAIQAYTNYLAQFPKSPNAVVAQYNRAECYAQPSVARYDLALKDYVDVSNRGPGTYYAKSSEKAALISFSSKDYQQAYNLGRRWEEAAPNSASRFDAQVLVLQTAYETKSRVAVDEYAAKILNSELANNNHRATAAFYQGKMAYDNQEFAKAYPLFQTVTQQSTAEIMAESYHRMIDIRYRQRQYAEAEELVTIANKASAGYEDWIARNLILLSDVYMAQGDINSAAAALEAVLENYRGGNPEIMDQARKKYEKVSAPAAKPTEGSKGDGGLLELDEGGE
ncbi:MAG: tetratricopeptide repeat protein [Saprospiraceae bacterium]|nr:tetratricopeptide repeat protein [Saprospiraceae bacterium]